MGDRQCPNCDGKGFLEVDFEGTPRSEWESLPRESRIAYDMGMVDFTSKTCSQCKRTGWIGGDG
jgi:hypothetical protein